MKTQNLSRIFLVAVATMLTHLSFAFGGGSLMGQVTDPETKEPVSDATVVLDNQGNQLVYITNQNGYYYASNITPGVYTVIVSYLSKTSAPVVVKVQDEQAMEVNINFSTSIVMKDIEIGASRNPRVPKIIDPLNPQVDIINKEIFGKMPIVKVVDVVALQPGVVEFDGEFYSKGSRSGSMGYYIDGVKVMGNPNIPLRGVDSYKMYTAFVPARYGDATGGIISIETRNFFGEQYY